MNTPLQTSTPSFVYHRIPTKVSRKDFNQYIETHLKRPKTGPKPKLSLYKIFNYILQIPPDFVVKSQAIDVAEVTSNMSTLLSQWPTAVSTHHTLGGIVACQRTYTLNNQVFCS